MQRYKIILNINIIILLSIFITGCTAQLTEINNIWGKENRQIERKLGVKHYSISKAKAMNAMSFAYQRLGFIVSNMDYKTGFMYATAKAPRPLSPKEARIMIDTEDERVKNHVSFFIWDFTDFDSDFNTMFLETENGIQISISGKLRFTGDRNTLVPVSEFPPKGLEIAYRKIWEEFEKTAFIQNKTLKNHTK